jgi:hypothetical protein
MEKTTKKVTKMSQPEKLEDNVPVFEMVELDEPENGIWLVLASTLAVIVLLVIIKKVL